jgi:WD40 repeat protein
LSHQEPDADGEHFIDRKPQQFHVILDFLRGYNVEKRIASLDDVQRQILQDDVDFYNTLTEHLKSICCLLPITREVILSGDSGGTIKIWNLNTKKCTGTIPYTTQNVEVMTMCQIDNETIAAGYSDQKIVLWNIKTLKSLGTINNQDQTECIRLLNSETLVTCSQNSIKIWDVKSKECVATRSYIDGKSCSSDKPRHVS